MPAIAGLWRPFACSGQARSHLWPPLTIVSSAVRQHPVGRKCGEQRPMRRQRTPGRMPGSRPRTREPTSSRAPAASPRSRSGPGTDSSRPVLARLCSTRPDPARPWLWSGSILARSVSHLLAVIELPQAGARTSAACATQSTRRPSYQRPSYMNSHTGYTATSDDKLQPRSLYDRVPGHRWRRMPQDEAMPRDINIEVRIDTPHVRQRLLDPLTDTPRREIS